MTEKWTPGPWTIGTVNFWWCCGSDGGSVAQIDFAMRDASEANANAHLIAAAPDLYEALERAVGTIRAFHDIGTPKDQRDDLWRLYQASPEMKAITAALAKARDEHA